MRGLSVHFLKTGFLNDVEMAGLARGSCVYEIEEKVLRGKGEHTRCPEDGEMGSAYVDTVTGEGDIGCSTYMLSYAWTYQVGDIVDTLFAFCQVNQLDPKHMYVWICCLCINQHRVKDRQRRGEYVPFEIFKEEFSLRVRKADRILAMMAPWRDPHYARRAWCIFEFSTAITEGKDLTILMPPREQEAFREALMTGALQRVYDTLSALRIQDASATVANDKVRILNTIAPRTLDYDTSPAVVALNTRVRDKLQAWFVETAAGHLERMSAQGDGSDLPAICVASQLLIEATGQYDRARALLEAGLVRCGRSGTSHASALELLGCSHRRQGDVVSALRYFTEAKTAYQAACATRSVDYAQLLVSMAWAYRDHGDGQAGLHHGVEAKAVYEAAGAAKSLGYGVLLDVIANISVEQGDSEAALRHCTEARAIFEAAGATTIPDYASVLCAMGSAYREEGDIESALRYYAEAKGCHDAAHTTNGRAYASLLKNIGAAHRAKGDTEVALGYYADAMSIYEASGITKGRAYAGLLVFIGIANRDQGDTEAALRHYAEGRTAYEAAGADRGNLYGFCLQNLGLAHHDQGDIEAALRHYAEAKITYEFAGIDKGPNYARLLHMIGTAHHDQGDIQASLLHNMEAKIAYEAAGATKRSSYTRLMEDIAKLVGRSALS